MKKQYLISLLGLAAISISLGNGFSSMTLSSTSTTASMEPASSSSSLSEEELNTIDEYSSSDEYFNYSIEEISMGDDYSAAVVNDGTGPTGDHLYTWGKNNDGQLGLGDDAKGHYNTPQEVTAFSGKDIEQIEMGTYSSFAIVNDGTGTNDTLYSWGDNKYGLLGLGNYDAVNIPTEVTSLPEGNIEDIAVANYSASLVVDNIFYTWGDNDWGWSLGLGPDFTDENYNTPQELTTLPSGDIGQIEMSRTSSAAIVDGILYTWGNDQEELLANGDGRTDEKTPKPVTTLPAGEIEDISIDYDTAGAVVDNVLYTWGNNTYGELGLGDEFTNQKYGTPHKVTIPVKNGDIEQISIGDKFSSAVIDNTLYTWGQNKYGQLGLGDKYTDEYYNTPQEVMSLPEGSVEQISVGEWHSSAIVDDENDVSLYTWGSNDNGQLGLGYNDIDENTPQEVWETPFIREDSISSSATISDDLDKVEINYEFETNLDVEDVTISFQAEDGSTITKVEDKPIASGEDLDNYESSLTINTDDGLVAGEDYTYTIELNYLTIEGQHKTAAIDEGEFSNSVVPVAPEFKEVNTQKNAATSIEIEFDLNLGYDQANNPYKLEEIIIDDNYHGEEWTYTKSGEDVQGKFIIDDSGEGYIEVKDLYPNTSYTWDITFVLSSPFEDDNHELYEELEPFSTETAEVESAITSSGVATVNGSTEATLDYNVNLGKDDFGETVKVEKVTWMNGRKLLAHSTSPSGTLKAEGLSPDTSYANTFVVAEMSDKTATNIVPVEMFTTESGAKTSSIVKTSSAKAISSTEATVGYDVIPGKDNNGDDLTVAEVKWMDNGNELAFSTLPGGTLRATDLSPNTLYEGTTLIARMSDGTHTEEVAAGDFTMDPGTVDSKVSENGNIEVKGPTEASVDYKVTPGKDVWGKPVTIDDVRWMHGADELDSSVDESGTLEADYLNPDTPYETKIIADMSDGTHPEISLESFTTDGVDKEAPLIDCIDVEVTDTTATFDYVVLDEGLDANGNPYILSNIEIKDDQGVIRDSEHVPHDNGKTGSVTVMGLTANTTYEDWTMEATFSDTANVELEEKITDEIGSFTTGTADLERPEIESTDVKTSSTTATFEYKVLDEGIDANGNPYTLSNITIKDEYGTVHGSESITADSGKEGSITVEGLDPNTAYKGWKMEATFTDTANVELNEKVTTNIQEFSTGAADLETPKIEYTIGEITDTTATLSYNVLDEGVDANGNPYTLTNIVIKDDKGNVVPNQSVNGEYGQEGSITITGLTPGTTYNGWTIEATFTDTVEVEVEEIIPTNLDEFETLLFMTDLVPSNPISNPHNLGTWTIVGISVVVTLLIVIIVGGLTYFIKRYKAIKA